MTGTRPFLRTTSCAQELSLSRVVPTPLRHSVLPPLLVPPVSLHNSQQRCVAQSGPCRVDVPHESKRNLTMCCMAAFDHPLRSTSLASSLCHPVCLFPVQHNHTLVPVPQALTLLLSCTGTSPTLPRPHSCARVPPTQIDSTPHSDVIHTLRTCSFNESTYIVMATDAGLQVWTVCSGPVGEGGGGGLCSPVCNFDHSVSLTRERAQPRSVDMQVGVDCVTRKPAGTASRGICRSACVGVCRLSQSKGGGVRGGGKEAFGVRGRVG